MKWVTKSVLVIVLSGISLTVHAALVNPGFESGLTGWQQINTSYTFLDDSTATDLAKVVTTHQPSMGGPSATYLPPAGNQFLLLQAGQANTWVTVSQTVSLSVGQTLSGYAAFSGWDELGYNDQAAVWIKHNGTETLLWHSDIAAVGSQGHSPWAAWGFTALDASSHDYELVFGVMNVDGVAQQERKFSSYGLFTAVPEPSTLLAGSLMGLLTLFSFARQARPGSSQKQTLN